VNGSLTLFGSLWSDDAKLPVGGTAVMQYSSEALALAAQAGGDQACRVTCVSEPNGAPCDDGDACTAADTCMDGRCTSGAPVACGLCAHCDSGRGCIGAPADACHAPLGGRSDLVIRRTELAVANRLVWRWRSARAPWDMGNAYVDYGLCLFGGPDGSTVLFGAMLPVASVCGERPCWTTPSHRYTDRLRTTGIATVKLNTSATGKTSIRVLGGGATLALPPLPVEPPIRVQLRAANGLCWEAAYPAPSVAQAEAGLRARIVMP
jgi:hypothetical protein